MRSAASTRGSRRFIWRMAGFWMVVIAVALAVVGIAMALLQTQSLTARLMADAQLRAEKLANDAGREFDRQINPALYAVAEHRRRHPNAPWNPPSSWPVWIDGCYVWSGNALYGLRLPSVRPDEITKLVQDRLAGLPPDEPINNPTDRMELLLDRLGTLPIILACLHVKDAVGQSTIIAAVVDHQRLKTDLLDILVESNHGLEVVAANEAMSRWACSMVGAFQSWAIQPTESFRRTQGRAVIGQTFVYVGLTLLALITLLAAMWFLIRLARREMALAEMKSDFVSNVSHELKTPLALIRMFIETLESDRVPSDEKRKEYYSIIARESARLTSLIDNLLDFSRIDAGRKEYTFEPIDVGLVLRETYEAYRLQMDEKQFEHSLAIEENLPAIQADRHAVSQALVNLIGNALKYSEDERYLAIEVTSDTRRNRRGVLISVHDRGIGISPEDRRHLFEGFFRADDERVRQRSGTGLGLALLKHFVDAHGGSLDVESRLVKGTTFRIFLPAINATSRNL